MDVLLQVKNLSVRYRSEGMATPAAVMGVCFEIAAGEVVGLVGESGCGKTTVARALLGLLPHSAESGGEMILQGRDMRSMDERGLERIRGAEIFLISQEPSLALSPVLQAGEQIAEALHAHRE